MSSYQYDIKPKLFPILIRVKGYWVSMQLDYFQFHSQRLRWQLQKFQDPGQHFGLIIDHLGKISRLIDDATHSTLSKESYFTWMFLPLKVTAIRVVPGFYWVSKMMMSFYKIVNT